MKASNAVEEALVVVFALVAMISSLGVIFTYYACSNWRRELRRIKEIMFLLRYELRL